MLISIRGHFVLLRVISSRSAVLQSDRWWSTYLGVFKGVVSLFHVKRGSISRYLVLCARVPAESIAEAALCKSVLKPLREPVYQRLEKFHTDSNSLKQLAQNQVRLGNLFSTAQHADRTGVEIV